MILGQMKPLQGNDDILINLCTQLTEMISNDEDNLDN